jgi:hypothetical protein
VTLDSPDSTASTTSTTSTAPRERAAAKQPSSQAGPAPQHRSTAAPQRRTTGRDGPTCQVRKRARGRHAGGRAQACAGGRQTTQPGRRQGRGRCTGPRAHAVRASCTRAHAASAAGERGPARCCPHSARIGRRAGRRLAAARDVTARARPTAAPFAVMLWLQRARAPMRCTPTR